MSQIEEHNMRILDILMEVNIVEEVVDPSLGTLEIAKAVFYVNGKFLSLQSGQKLTRKKNTNTMGVMELPMIKSGGRK